MLNAIKLNRATLPLDRSYFGDCCCNNNKRKFSSFIFALISLFFLSPCGNVQLAGIDPIGSDSFSVKHSLSVQKNRALGNSQLFPARPYPKMQKEEEEEFRIVF